MSDPIPFSIEYTIHDCPLGLDLLVKTDPNQKYFVNLHLPCQDVRVESGQIHINPKICSPDNENSSPERIGSTLENKENQRINLQKKKNIALIRFNSDQKTILDYEEFFSLTRFDL
jgi:hypothetical protein